MQIDPASPQSPLDDSVTVTSSSESGSTVISNRSLRSSTRCTRVTAPPVAASASSRSEVGLMPTSLTKATWKLNSLSPSWDRGTSLKRAVIHCTAWPGDPSGDSSDSSGEGHSRPTGTLFESSAISTHSAVSRELAVVLPIWTTPVVLSSQRYNGPYPGAPDPFLPSARPSAITSYPRLWYTSPSSPMVRAPA